MSEALKLAEWLDSLPRATNAVGHMSAAMELRRLHAENVRLQAAVAAARAEERERCAEICKRIAHKHWDHEGGALACSEAIRAGARVSPNGNGAPMADD